jgi:hypothetical protein
MRQFSDSVSSIVTPVVFILTAIIVCSPQVVEIPGILEKYSKYIVRVLGFFFYSNSASEGNSQS